VPRQRDFFFDARRFRCWRQGQFGEYVGQRHNLATAKHDEKVISAHAAASEVSFALVILNGFDKLLLWPLRPNFSATSQALG